MLDLAEIESTTFFDPEEVADLLRTNRRHVYGLCRRGELSHVKVGRLFRVPGKALASFITANTIDTLAS